MQTGHAQAGSPHGLPKYLTLAKRFERQLKTGTLRVGDRLPSVRQLRTDYHISAATAVGCYLWLEQQGYVRARPKSGFYVSRTPMADGLAPTSAGRLKGPVPVRLADFGVGDGTTVSRREVIELGPAVIGPDLLPRNRLNRSIRTALSAFGDNAVRYEEPNGNARLRRQIARLVFRQGAACSPDDIIVTSGATEALNLSVRAVARPGDVIAVESPSCYEMLQTLEALHVRVVEVPHVLHHGIDLELLAAAARKHPIKAVLTNTTCHNPFGDCTDDASKAALVAFAVRHDIAIIEGDTFGDLVFSGERPKPLKAFDTTGIVLQCSSLAHQLAPGFNLGWSNAGQWQPEVARLKAITNVAGARLPQLAMAEFLESGSFEKHIKRLRIALWQSVEATRQEILKLFPAGTLVSRPEGGFVLWVQLPDAQDGREVQKKAAAAGINILPGAIFSPTGEYRDCIRISCGHLFTTIRPAIRTLAKIVGGGRG